MDASINSKVLIIQSPDDLQSIASCTTLAANLQINTFASTVELPPALETVLGHIDYRGVDDQDLPIQLQTLRAPSLRHIGGTISIRYALELQSIEMPELRMINLSVILSTLPQLDQVVFHSDFALNYHPSPAGEVFEVVNTSLANITAWAAADRKYTQIRIDRNRFLKRVSIPNLESLTYLSLQGNCVNESGDCDFSFPALINITSYGNIAIQGTVRFPELQTVAVQEEPVPFSWFYEKGFEVDYWSGGLEVPKLSRINSSLSIAVRRNASVIFPALESVASEIYVHPRYNDGPDFPGAHGASGPIVIDRLLFPMLKEAGNIALRGFTS